LRLRLLKIAARVIETARTVRLAFAACHDESLLEAMKTSPGGPINAWGESVGKSRSSIISALHRLRDQGVVENSDGVWSLATQQEALAQPPVKWVAPVRGTDRAQQHHLT
jgi:hypothetical protein